MRNLKRALSLMLSAALIIGMMVISAGAADVYEDFTDKDEIQNAEAVQTLVTLNVINGKEDGSYFDPAGIVTRAEMAKMITIVLNGGIDPVLGVKDTPTFSDIRGHWAESYIEYCTSPAVGAISGRGDGTFDPDATVTVAEAAKMLLVVLGYDSDVFELTGGSWQVNTDVHANNAGLYEGLSLNSSAPLSRDDTAQMVYNALNAYIMERSYDKVLSNGQISYNYNLSEYKTLLNHTYGVYKVEGIVVANEYADLGVADSSIKEGTTALIVTNPDELRTGSNTYALSVSSTVDSNHKDYDKADTFNVTTSAAELGQVVTLFVRPSTTSTVTTRATIIGDPIVSENNVVATISENKDTETKVTNWLKDAGMKLDTDTILVEDYETGVDGDNVFDDIAAASDLMNLGNGIVVTAIDNDADGKVEYVFITNYAFTKVASINTSGNTITLTGRVGGAMDMDDVVAYDGIAKNDYVIYNEAGGRMYIAQPETVTGTPSAYNDDGDITIDGTTYSRSNTPVLAAESNWSVVSKTNNSTAGAISYTTSLTKSEATLYLDPAGYAVVLGSQTNLSAENVCAVVKVANHDNMGTSQDVYVYFADGTHGVYEVSSVNGSADTKLGADEAGLYTYTLSGDSIALDNRMTNSKTGRVELGTDDTLATAKGVSKLTFTDAGSGSNSILVNGGSHTGNLDVYASDETVYFLIDTSKSVGATGYMKVITGMSNVGANSYTGAAPTGGNIGAGAEAMYTISGSTNNAVAVMGWGAGAAKGADSVDVIYVVDTKYTYDAENDANQINVIMPGESEVSQIAIANDAFPTVGMFTYSVDANNVYTLTPVASNKYEGLIKYINNQVIEKSDGTQLNITSDTLIIDVRDLSSNYGNVGTIDAADLNSLSAYAYVKYNDDYDISAIYLIGNYATLTTLGGASVSAGTNMGTKADPIEVNHTNTGNLTVADGVLASDDYGVSSSAVNAEVKVYTDTAFVSSATDGELADGTYYVTVSADNAQTVYYEITLS